MRSRGSGRGGEVRPQPGGKNERKWSVGRSPVAGSQSVAAPPATIVRPVGRQRSHNRRRFWNWSTANAIARERRNAADSGMRQRLRFGCARRTLGPVSPTAFRNRGPREPSCGGLLDVSSSLQPALRLTAVGARRGGEHLHFRSPGVTPRRAKPGLEASKQIYYRTFVGTLAIPASRAWRSLRGDRIDSPAVALTLRDQEKAARRHVANRAVG